MKKRILIFDDDFRSMVSLRDFLENRGYAVELTAEQEILSRLSIERFDLVCVDQMIHRQSPNQGGDIVDNVHFEDIGWQDTGREFLRRLRAGQYEGVNGSGTPSTVPVIVISATAEPSLNHGADRVFEKPFDVEQVLSVIDALL